MLNRATYDRVHNEGDPQVASFEICISALAVNSADENSL